MSESFVEQPEDLDNYVPGALTQAERWWIHHRPWLEHCGYILRPRYQPGWAPSWEGKKGKRKVWFDDYEDGQYLSQGLLMDAQRVSDGSFVYLKRMERGGSGVADELQIGQFLSSEALRTDPRNHCVPIIEELHCPNGESIMVMPLLRPFYDPKFQTFGEAVAFFEQLFEGFQFMHEHRVVHGDCTAGNVMIDPTHLYPKSFHPRQIDRRRDWKGAAPYTTRTLSRPRYYFINYGLSHRYTPEEVPPLRKPVHGVDRTAPEHRNYNTPCNPFPTDVYYLGNLIRRKFSAESYGFEFMEPLLSDMVQEDPAKRPLAGDVVARFRDIRASLSNWKLRSRIVWRDERRITPICLP